MPIAQGIPAFSGFVTLDSPLPANGTVTLYTGEENIYPNFEPQVTNFDFDTPAADFALNFQSQQLINEEHNEGHTEVLADFTFTTTNNVVTAWDFEVGFSSGDTLGSIFQLYESMTSHGDAYSEFNCDNGSVGPCTRTTISSYSVGTLTAVPIPASAWLMLSALSGLGFTARRRN